MNYCDWGFKRSALCWTRAFELRIPVHEPQRWNDPAVSTTLHAVLRFLTGDSWTITFIARAKPYEPPPEQPLPMSANSRAVIAYSRGLDSFSVAGWFAAEHGDDTLIRVRVGRGDKTRPKKVPFAAVPFRVRPPPRKAHETSGRSRGFKFAAASGLAAYLSNVSELIVPESGSGALGPVLVGYNRMYPDYRNHPRFFRLMEAFLSALLRKQLTFRLPRLQATKGESVLAYLDHAKVDRANALKDVLRTHSCWQSRHYVAIDGTKRQCGICASCMLRRLSMHVAGNPRAARDLQLGRPERSRSCGGRPRQIPGRDWHYADRSRDRGHAAPDASGPPARRL